jgi:hypothetical protein
VFFARDQFAPRRVQGRWLLAHELAHVVQTTTGVAPPVCIQRFEAERELPGETTGDAELDHLYEGFEERLRTGRITGGRAVSREMLSIIYDDHLRLYDEFVGEFGAQSGKAISVQKWLKRLSGLIAEAPHQEDGAKTLEDTFKKANRPESDVTEAQLRATITTALTAAKEAELRGGEPGRAMELALKGARILESRGEKDLENMLKRKDVPDEEIRAAIAAAVKAEKELELLGGTPGRAMELASEAARILASRRERELENTLKRKDVPDEEIRAAIAAAMKAEKELELLGGTPGRAMELASEAARILESATKRKPG